MSATTSTILDALCDCGDPDRFPVKVTISEALALRLSANSPGRAVLSEKLFGIPCNVSPHLDGTGWVVELRNGTWIVGQRAEAEAE